MGLVKNTQREKKMNGIVKKSGGAKVIYTCGKNFFFLFFYMLSSCTDTVPFGSKLLNSFTM